MKTKTVGAFAYITNPEGKVLLVRQSYDEKRWGMPGGGVETGEDPRDAVAREVLEEAGLKVTVGDLIGVYVSIYRDDIVFVFEAHAKDYQVRPRDGEISEVGFFLPQDIPAPHSPNLSVRLKDAAEGKRGILRVMQSPGVIKP